jgi:hypothetical protein
MKRLKKAKAVVVTGKPAIILLRLARSIIGDAAEWPFSDAGITTKPKRLASVLKEQATE